MSFVHLHTKSEYTLLGSTVRTKELLTKSADFNFPAVALTDKNNLFGAIEFYAASKSINKVKPVIGIELSIAEIISTKKSNATHNEINSKSPSKPHCYSVVMLAKNRRGYLQISNLSSLATANNPESPFVTFEQFAEYQSECFVLSGGLGSELFSLLARDQVDGAEALVSRFHELLGERYYLEVHDHRFELEKKVIDQIVQLGTKQKIPLVATNEVCYLERNDWISYEVLYSIGAHKEIGFSSGQIDLKKHQTLQGMGYHFKTYEEMLGSFSHLPEAISNTVKIAEQCELDLKDESIHMPIAPLPPEYDGRTDNEYIREESFGRLEKKIDTLSQVYIDRLNYELDIIIDKGYASYFIIVADFIDFAREQKILVGCGRGSAAGSLISYSLGITSLDPIEYGLIFERFLNPERPSFPDIDIDFEDQRRSEVIEYVKRKYGEDHVSQIITFGKLKTKAAFKDVARVFKVKFEEANALTSLLKEASDSEKESKGKMSLLKFRYENDFEFSNNINRSPLLQTVYEQALKLENLTRQVGIHAAGIVVTEKPMNEFVPLLHTVDNAVLTQYDKDLLEGWCGLIKMDLLGLTVLSVLSQAVKLTKEIYGQEVDIDNPPLNDRKSFSLFARELTEGIFQFSSVGMKRYLSELHPQSLDELVAMNALYRPGPMAWIPVYIAEKRGRKPNFNQPQDEENFNRFKKICDEYEPLKKVLQETGLIPIYQEQIMEVCQVYAGFTLGKADTVRKAMGKKDLKLIEELRLEFIDGASLKGHQKPDAEFIYNEFIQPFGGYGFNKSHAACYAYLAYQTAYLKANFPLAFMTALFNSELSLNNIKNFKNYVQESVAMKIEVMAPDINISGEMFEVKNQYILYGLGAIKNVGLSAAKNIVEERQQNGDYLNLGDFLLRHRPEKMTRGVVEALIKAGVFDNLKIPSDLLLTVFEEINDRTRKAREMKSQGQMNFFELAEDGDQDQAHLYQDLLEKSQEQTSQLEKVRELEMESLGFSLKHDPTINFRHVFEKLTNFDTVDDSGWRNGEVQLGAVVQSVMMLYTKKDAKEMLKLEVNDGNTLLTVLAFSRAWEKIKTNLKEKFAFDEFSGSAQILEKLKNQVVALKLIIRDDTYNAGKKSLSINSLEIVDVENEENQSDNQKKDFYIEVVAENYLDPKELKKMGDTLRQYPGEQKVILVIRDQENRSVHPTKHRVTVCDALKMKLTDYPWVRTVK